MTKHLKYAAAALLTFTIASLVHATQITYNQNLVNEPALTHNATYPLDLMANGIGSLSAQVVYTSATIANKSFSDGAQSVGSFSVADNTLLLAASASNSVRVLDNAALTGAFVIVPGFQLYQGQDWAVGASAAATAANIATALAKVPGLLISRPNSGDIIYTTAPVSGSYYNSWTMASSDNAALQVAHANFTGGRDATSISINGVVLRAGINFAKGSAASDTATNIATAINANSILNRLVIATASSADVNLKSVRNGLNTFALASSNTSAISKSGAAMGSGVATAVDLAASSFHVPSHSFSSGLPVLYSTGGATSNPIGGLTNQTTYYAIPLDSDNIQLASSQVNALASPAVPVVLTSTSTHLAASVNTLTLAPLAIAGTPGFYWQVSNDNSNWSSLAVSSVTVSSYSNPAASILWSFGYIGPRYLRLNVVGPTAGGLNIQAIMVGTN